MTGAYCYPIKHARNVLASHPHHGAFAEFGDPQGYRDALRR